MSKTIKYTAYIVVMLLLIVIAYSIGYNNAMDTSGSNLMPDAMPNTLECHHEEYIEDDVAIVSIETIGRQRDYVMYVTTSNTSIYKDSYLLRAVDTVEANSYFYALARYGDAIQCYLPDTGDTFYVPTVAVRKLSRDEWSIIADKMLQEGETTNSEGEM